MKRAGLSAEIEIKVNEDDACTVSAYASKYLGQTDALPSASIDGTRWGSDRVPKSSVSEFGWFRKTLKGVLPTGRVRPRQVDSRPGEAERLNLNIISERLRLFQNVVDRFRSVGFSKQDNESFPNKTIFSK